MAYLKQLDRNELEAMLSPEDRKRLKANSGLRGVAAFAVFENRDRESPEFGRRTVIPVGPSQAVKSVEELRGTWIGDGPNKRHAIAFHINL